MAQKIIRGIFVFSCVVMGVIWANHFSMQGGDTAGAGISLFKWRLLGGTLGALASTIILVALHFITHEIYERLAPAVLVMAVALVLGFVISQYILMNFEEIEETVGVYITVSLVLLFGFAGISLGLTHASRWESLLSSMQQRDLGMPAMKLVDTSVIIDGRIADICESGFIEGTLLVPQFILKELQFIADSSDVLRRAKGRRGLDILKTLQEGNTEVQVKITEENPKDVREVDGKLIFLAKKHRAKILTNDFNLNKVAQIEGIDVLNINDLANALKPAVLPDEQLEVKIIKEGKEPSQGVGYLDDGTMIVVDGGRIHMGKTVAVTVTSVLQTAAGRMIFTRFENIVL